MMQWDNRNLRRILSTLVAFMVVLTIGTLGYRTFSHGEPSYFDCLYMTVITVSTIGYGEVVDITHSTSGRLFTMFIAVMGIGMLTYLISQITAYVIEGHLKITLINRKIEKMVNKLEGHYIICGYGRVGRRIMDDMTANNKPFVLIDSDEEKVGFLKDQGVLVITGDATEDDTLEKAGIAHAIGLFASTGQDNQNLVITLSSKLLNPELRIICRCEDQSQEKKMMRAGAHTVISTACIGGTRMLHEMVYPTVTTMVDQLFYSQEQTRSVKSISTGFEFSGKTIGDLNLKDFNETLIMAHRCKDKQDFSYNPKRSLVLNEGDILVVMTTREEAEALSERMMGEVLK
jgi:voltage-gated potassium channel